MTRWIVKAAMQRAVGFLPARHVLSDALKAAAPGEAKFVDALMRTRGHMEAYEAVAPKPVPRRVVEIGTGWYPIGPLAFWLCGAEEVTTIDLLPHLTPSRLRATLVCFQQHWEHGKLQELLPHLVRQRAEALAVLAQAPDPRSSLESVGMRYLVQDITHGPLPHTRADLLFSTAVLGHIPYPALVSLLGATARLIDDHGYASHWIGLMDLYAYFDRRITPYNFLRFSNRIWNIIDNPIIPQNRLRYTDYQRAFAESDWHVISETLGRGKRADLAAVPLASEFREYSVDDLLVLDAWVLTRKRVTADVASSSALSTRDCLVIGGVRPQPLLAGSDH